MGRRSQKLPPELTIELLQHMSEEGRFEQTLSEFPNFKLREIRETFAWLAQRVKEQIPDDYADDKERFREFLNQFSKRKEISPKTREVLNQLPPEKGRALLRNFGALD